MHERPQMMTHGEVGMLRRERGTCFETVVLSWSSRNPLVLMSLHLLKCRELWQNMAG